MHTILSLKAYDYVPKLSSYGQGQGHTNTRLAKNVLFSHINVICSRFVVILSLYLIAIDIIKCSLNTNTFLLHNAAKVKVKVINTETFWSFHENLGMFITHLLGFYISVFTLCPPVNFLCCTYMTNLFIQKVKVTESKHLTQKHYVSSSLRVFVQNLFCLQCSLMSI